MPTDSRRHLQVRSGWRSYVGTFTGLPKPTQEDVLLDDMCDLGDIMKYRRECSRTKKPIFLQNLKQLPQRFNRYCIVREMFENRPETKGPGQIYFAYVDFDFYKSIREALEFVYERLSIGGAGIVDDYGFFSAGAQHAGDEFVAARREAYEFRVVSPDYGYFCILRRRI